MKFNLSAPNLICICVDEAAERTFVGRLYHYYQKSPIFFQNADEVSRVMEKLCDDIDYPQMTVNLREFHVEGKEKTEKPELVKQQGADDLMKESGKVGTFFLAVTSRRQACWQGEIYFLEEDEKCFFQSYIEMWAIIQKHYVKES